MSASFLAKARAGAKFMKSAAQRVAPALPALARAYATGDVLGGAAAVLPALL